MQAALRRIKSRDKLDKQHNERTTTTTCNSQSHPIMNINSNYTENVTYNADMARIIASLNKL